MSKTIYVDCNRLNAIDSGSNNTAEWTYDLRDTLNIPAGSAIQIQNSFINQKGILGSSIEIEEDIQETLMYYVYTTEEKKALPVGGSDGGIPFVDALVSLNHNILHSAPTTATDVAKLANRFLQGGSQIPLIMYKSIEIDGVKKVHPVYQSKQITIKKGIYGINQLAELITDQINGKKTISNFPINPEDLSLSNQEFKGNIADPYTLSSNVQQSKQTGIIYPTGGAGLTAVAKQYSRIDDMGSEANISATFDTLGYANDFNYVFIDGYTHQNHINTIVSSNVHTTQLYQGWTTGENLRANAHISVFTDAGVTAPAVAKAKDHTKANTQAQAQGNIDDYRLNMGYTIGALNFALSFDSDRNGYTINNLHLDNLISSNDLEGNAQPQAGRIAVEMRNPADYEYADDGLAHTFIIGEGLSVADRIKINNGLRKPVSRQGGAIVYNFAIDTAVKLGDRITDGLDEVVVSNWKFSDYFTSQNKAEVAWKKTLWSRLGFSYNQLNTDDYFEELTSFNKTFKTASNPKGLRLGGITTDAETDIAQIPTISTLVNPYAFTNPDTSAGVAPNFASIQVHSGASSNNPRRGMADQYAVGNNITSYKGSMNNASTTDIVVTQPKAIVADRLPTLSHFGYYLVSSNIVAENDDIVQKGSPIPLLGVIPKSSLSSQDFISSENDIVHVTTQPQIVNNIKISVFNPDLTQPILDEASAVVLKIIMPVEQPSPATDKKSK
tara:strand:- start:2711 stop:4885 length:2175 start_codon:yes stop_codon:yes gene_type:complete